ncbi:MAG: Crp/Fnr family transcriptional regulator [Desulfobacterales bacterium]
MDPEEFLRQVSLFHSLSPEDIERLSSSVRTQSLKKGEVLFHKGSEGTVLYIIKKGRVKILLPSRSGDEVILAIFSETDFFGEMALLDGIPRSADAVAMEDCELFVLDRSDFLTFLMENRNAVKSILASLSMRLRKTDDHLEDTCFLNISGRFAKKLLELVGTSDPEDDGTLFIDLALTQSELASMIGATRESVNKELRLLREKGLITTVGKRIGIVNMERLRRRVH